MKKKDLIRINILQGYYEHQINVNVNDPDCFCSGISLGFRLSLQHFGYNIFELENMEFVYNELIRLKK